MQFKSKSQEGKRLTELPSYREGAILFNEKGDGGYWAFGNTIYAFSCDIPHLMQQYSKKRLETIRGNAKKNNIILKSKEQHSMEKELITHIVNDLAKDAQKTKLFFDFSNASSAAEAYIDEGSRINIEENKQKKEDGFEGSQLTSVEDMTITHLSLFENMLIIGGLSKGNYQAKFFDLQEKKFIERPNEAFEITYFEEKKETVAFDCSGLISIHDIAEMRGFNKLSNFRTLFLDVPNNAIVVCKKDNDIQIQDKEQPLMGDLSEEKVPVPAIYYGEFIPTKIKPAIALLNKQTALTLSTVYDAFFMLCAVEADYTMSKIPAYVTNKASNAMKASIFSWWNRTYSSASNWYAALGRTTQSRFKWIAGAGVAAGIASFGAWLFSKNRDTGAIAHPSAVTGKLALPVN